MHDPTDPIGRLLFTSLSMIAEFEADLARARTREGMAVARAKGRLRGKQPKLSPRQEAHLVELYRAGGRAAPVSTRAEAAAASETAVRLNLVAAWREATVFTEAERAALALAEEGTRLADANHSVSDETWAQVRKHYYDDQIAALVSLVALINAANRLAVILHQKGVPTSPACSPRSTDRQANPGLAQDHSGRAGPGQARWLSRPLEGHRHAY